MKLDQDTATEIRRASLRWLAAHGVSSNDQEDLFQASVAKMLSRLDQLKENQKLVPWFIQILRNTTIDHFRKNKSSQKALEQLAKEPEDTEEELEARLCQCIEKSIDKLSHEDQVILRKHYIGGVSFDALADELKKSSQALRTRATRAKGHVRALLEKSCGVKTLGELNDCCD